VTPPPGGRSYGALVGKVSAVLRGPVQGIDDHGLIARPRDLP
jgi:hypothetical protein